MKDEEIQGSRTFLNPKIQKMISVLATMNGVTEEVKARWMFVTSTSLTSSNAKSYRKFNAGLQKLKKDIDRSQIIKYTDKDRNVKLEGVHRLLTGTNKTPSKRMCIDNEDVEA